MAPSHPPSPLVDCDGAFCASGPRSLPPAPCRSAGMDPRCHELEDCYLVAPTRHARPCVENLACCGVGRGLRWWWWRRGHPLPNPKGPTMTTTTNKRPAFDPSKLTYVEPIEIGDVKLSDGTSAKRVTGFLNSETGGRKVSVYDGRKCVSFPVDLAAEIAAAIVAIVPAVQSVTPAPAPAPAPAPSPSPAPAPAPAPAIPAGAVVADNQWVGLPDGTLSGDGGWKLTTIGGVQYLVPTT